MRRVLATICLLFVTISNSPNRLSAQGALQSFGNSVAWRVSPTVPAGSVSGLILSDRGTPVEGAQVTIEGGRVGATTRPDGTFTLVHSVGREAQLRIMALGWREVRETLVLPADHGVFMTAILQIHSMHDLCYEIIVVGGTSLGDLAVQVVDAVTGLPPDAVVTLRVEHETGTFENAVPFTPEDTHRRLGLGRDIETEGSHSIEVSAPGYRTWRLEDVRLELIPGCMPNLLNRFHRAELIRADHGGK